MTATKTLLTIEDIAALPDDCARYELLDGEIVEMSPANPRHAEVMAVLAALLLTYVRAERLGRVLCGDPGIILQRGPDRLRAPDVCFFARGRFAGDVVPNRFTDVIPDLVAEIVSPGDSATAVQQKTEEWLARGVRLVWNVDPENRTVAVYTEPGAARILHEDDTLTGDPVLPGFSVAVAEIFA